MAPPRVPAWLIVAQWATLIMPFFVVVQVVWEAETTTAAYTTPDVELKEGLMQARVPIGAAASTVELEEGLMQARVPTGAAASPVAVAMKAGLRSAVNELLVAEADAEANLLCVNLLQVSASEIISTALPSDDLPEAAPDAAPAAEMPSRVPTSRAAAKVDRADHSLLQVSTKSRVAKTMPPEEDEPKAPQPGPDAWPCAKSEPSDASPPDDFAANDAGDAPGEAPGRGPEGVPEENRGSKAARDEEGTEWNPKGCQRRCATIAAAVLGFGLLQTSLKSAVLLSV